ncbi:uncharacterized protein [Coffea arabica]|uniref:CCR4-NOT transcription complex subunit 9-like n=1 Tax=Coffea arabica TaxID=13443 RepID=A0ABM4UFR5_COFAR
MLSNLNSNIPYYLYPFLQAKADDKALAQIRLSSLAVLCAFVMCEDPVQAQSVVHFLLESEAFPLCLSWMDKGTGRTQELATLIVAKILMQEKGLHYCSSRADRLFVTLQVLTGMVDQIARSPSASMLHKVVYCLVRLSGAARSEELTESMRSTITAKLRDDSFREIYQDPVDFVCNQTIQDMPNVVSGLRKCTKGNPEISSLVQQLARNLTPGFRPNP